MIALILFNLLVDTPPIIPVKLNIKLFLYTLEFCYTLS